MKVVFLVFTTTLIVLSCGKKNTSGGAVVCHRRNFEKDNCVRMYLRIYGPDYTNEMCTRNVQTVACN